MYDHELYFYVFIMAQKLTAGSVLKYSGPITLWMLALFALDFGTNTE